MTRRIINTVCALVAGAVTAPLALVVYPAFVAWFVWNETENN